jgi:haloacid dehalogenase superfamily, subfamily IA, variant 3 with third motif having DD or ED/haloacid dehalogenase superfamily, subfamily IA, variant 1 with third motif having Dx(3-4)D or Dx(3-4)E
MKEYDAYLFDADGTLMDTREIICQSFAHMGERMKAALPPRDYIESTIGQPVEVQLRQLLGENHDEAYYERAREFYRDHMERIYPKYLRLFPGTMEMLTALKAKGKKMAVVTSRRRKSLKEFFATLGIWDFFDTSVTPEDVQKPKPDAEPALLACARLGVPPERTVFVGDALFDIASGNAAGMDTAYVEWGGMEYLGWPVQPDFVANAMSDLLPEG